MALLLYQGHGSYRITTKEHFVVYVDPYAGKGYDIPADLVIVTHEHSDHNHVELVTLKSNGKILRSSDLLVRGEYKTVALNNIKIEATPAYNKNHSKSSCVGCLISVDNLVIYAAGDTSKTKYMSELAKREVDYALLPIDGVFNMDAKEASECAKIIGAKHSIPVHMKPGFIFDEEKAESFHADGRIILKPGMEINL